MEIDSINRSVAVIKPKQPFLDWLNALPDSEQPFTLTDLQTDCTVLLLPEFGNDHQAQKFISKNLGGGDSGAFQEHPHYPLGHA
jgi:hypothetical protein